VLRVSQQCVSAIPFGFADVSLLRAKDILPDVQVSSHLTDLSLAKLTRRTKFPIKAIATLRALAANISPIPVPKTVVAPEPRKQHEPSKKIRLTVQSAAAA